jgi:hypothetical protein
MRTGRRRLGIFEAFLPRKPEKPPALPALRVPTGLPALPREIVRLPAAALPFQIFAPPVEAPPRLPAVISPFAPPAPAAPPRELWEAFMPAEEIRMRERPVEAERIFAPFAEAPVREEPPVQPPPPRERRPEVPRALFTIEEYKGLLWGGWDLDAFYAEVVAMRSTPWWLSQVAEAPHRGEPAVMEVGAFTDVNDVAFYSNLAESLFVPWNVFDEYLTAGKAMELMDRVVEPAAESMGKALTDMAPIDVPGWFEVGWDPTRTIFGVFYREIPPRPRPLSGRRIRR